MADGKILLVVDPSKRDNNAIPRIIGILDRFSRAGSFDLATLITTNLDGIDSGTNNVSIDKGWTDELQQAIADGGYQNSAHIAWSSDWAATVLEHVDAEQAEFCIIPFYDHRSANVLSDQKWKLLRNAKTPVLLTNGVPEQSSNVVLAAIKSQDPDYEKSNQKVLDAVNSLAASVGSEVHIVNAYDGSMDYPDRSKIVKLTEVDNERIHVEEGPAKDVLSAVAQQLDATAIYVANHQRKGLTGSLRGNTVEKIIQATDCDIVMV